MYIFVVCVGSAVSRQILLHQPAEKRATQNYITVSVWRANAFVRSEFLGCLTFPLSALAEQQHIYGVTGSYKLHAQGCQHSCRSRLHAPSTASRPQQLQKEEEEEEKQRQEQEQEQELSETEEQQLTEDSSKMTTMAATALKSSNTNSNTNNTNNTATTNNSNSNTNTNTNTNSNSNNTTTAVIASTTVLSDEVISISIDSMAAATGPLGKDDLLPQQPQQPMVLSKKALHQRDADENLFLRFLELDPPADGNANSTTTAAGNSTAGASAGGTGGGGGGGTGGGGSGGGNANANANASNANHMNGGSTRRCSTMATGRQPTGRTPFTMTKRLTRTEERGFGFSIVWTHPPRVEKVEAGLSADRCGILPGDYVIFVDKHNVVTMPEADVLNLIRSQGSSLTLEIFRRSGAGANMTNMTNNITTVTVNASSNSHNTHHNSSHTLTHVQTHSHSHHHQQQQRPQLCADEHATAAAATTTTTTTAIHNTSAILQRTSSTRVPGFMGNNQQSRPATACSGTTSSIEAAKRRLHLPQVTFSKESIVPITDNRRRFLLQLISREQNFTAALHFGLQRFVQPLVERKDLISPNDHRTLFQNIDELLRIAEDILEQLCSNDQEQEPHMNFASRVYLSKTTAICAAYKKYCNGIKRADCVLVNKSRQTGSEFISFITEPAVPRKRPDLTMFIHRPLQHFREILKLMQLLAGNCHVDTEEHKNFSTVINELQAAYREITVSSGLMEPLGEGRPLLTLQDLESRMVFTKCKPFTLAVQGRQWIFGGDLSRVEGRSIKPYWTLLFSDIIVFAKVSRDRVLFITEEPIPIANVVDSCFHMRKKTTEFRLTVDPNGRLAESPTGYCAPDLTRTPKRGARRKSLILRAPSLELKAVWQNLLQRQIFLVNAALGSTPLSSPLDSPDVLNTLVPLSDIGMTSASMGSMKLPSLDSINLKQQKQQQRNAGQHGHAVEQIELLIDEKCRILNKTGTPKSSALHLANWMKGQLDKQQQQARLVAIARSQENVSAEDEQLIFNSDSEQDERIIYWTRQQLEKRTKELNLAKENGGLSAKPNFGGKRLSGVEELSMSATSDIYSEAEVVPSQISQSHSTTSDSQITVRSSPIVLDKLAVCRHCHKNCQQSAAGGRGSGSVGGGAAAGGAAAGGGSSLVCNSLKVQHSQSSPNRCCKLNGNGNAPGAPVVAGCPPTAATNTRTTRTGTGTGTGSVTSMSSGTTVTGELSSKVVASSSRRETGDTESDVAQLITDELSLSQSEATDDSVGAMPNSSSSCSVIADAKLRVLEQHQQQQQQSTPLANGHCSGAASISNSASASGSASASVSASASASASASVSGSPKAQPQPPPRRNVTRIVAHASQEPTRPRANQQVKAIVTITETARIMRSSDRPTGAGAGASGSGSMSGSPAKYAACHCRCAPEDFSQTQLGPDKMEQQTCKLLESPKQKATAVQRQEDEQLSLMLIGLAQFAPTAKLCGQSPGQQSKEQRSPLITLNDQKVALTTLPTQTPTPTPTIAVVPPTPDAVLTKTSTHVWDNSGGAVTASSSSTATTTSTTSTATAKQPRQAIIENIPEDSCDESPLEEEPPYRPMSNALRRFGTMSSLEKLPSDELDELEDLESYAQNGLNEEAEAKRHEDANDADDDDDDELDADADADDEDADADDAAADKAMAQNLHELAACSSGGSISVTISNGEVLASGAWTNRAGAFVSDKMSFFEESRAFIDKYLGRWNVNEQPQQSQLQGGNQTASETDEQMDECTSGATSGEEVWGTPTSGGDNDDMQLINSENTHSSPTKSSTSLNDDDDTELMMDELLMAPPMTASTIRGLLPRRRLEPLFEEETESDEEKTQQDSDDIKKGEATTNGHYLEDSAGSSSEEAPLSVGDPRDEEEELDLNEDEEEEEEEEEEPDHSSEDRLQPNLATTALGPRPLAKPLTTTMLLPTTAITDSSSTPPSQSRERSQVVVVPPPVASSCEYLLEQRPSIAATTSSTSSITNHATMTTTTTTTTIMTMTTTKMMMTTTTTTTMTSTAMPTMPANICQRAPATTASRAPSSITTTTSSGSDTISSAVKAIVKPPRFIPPPPPPRRLLLTQTNLSAAAGKAPPPQRKSGATADSGCSAAVADAASASPTIGIGSRTMPASTRTSAASSTSGPKRASSTIIETCLLGAAAPGGSVTSSATVSRMAKPSRSIQSSPAAVQPPLPARERERVREEDNGAGAGQRTAAVAPVPHVGCGLSPRLEMRLALNHDILGDEDLICYEPGPDLTTILGHDLSTFHRLTGRDLLSRSATNRVQPKEAVISYSQQRNSKMDTPTVNRRPRPAVSGVVAASGSGSAPRSRSSSSHGSPRAVGSARAVGDRQRPHPNPNTWSSSASAARAVGGSANVDGNSTNCSSNSGASKLGDLEILARREKIYCMSQLRSGYQVRATSETTTKLSATTDTTTMTATTSTSRSTTATTTTTMTTRRDCSLPTSRAAAAASLTRTMSTTSMDAVEATTTTTEPCLETEAGKSNRLINFIKRRNSEITAGGSSSSNPNNNSDSTYNEQQQLMLQLHPSHSQSSQLLRQSPDAADMAQMSPRKDNDKPSLNRRLWKQITKRRRTNSVSQIVAG
ncbi:pneumococcal serine-rich repeat protein isoform X2 [Drosophila albomicans]|uniref:Pneumococcal serine-rich repeat protein isoform X2 n=1 Tax=Drosophila albomicans TaxID=7291 RepID=A0A9C6SRN1_DROAB|nr:pneumococcal serine-rich repeat protein isoform X2 [Drosophila albomicans]